MIVAMVAGQQFLSKNITISPESLNRLLEDFGTSFDPVTLYTSVELAMSSAPVNTAWRINEYYEDGILNVYIIDTKLSSWSKELRNILKIVSNNAIYIGSLQSIIVDIQLINILSNRFFPGEDDSSWGTRGYVVDWIVAHEVGHYLAAHNTAHFGADSFLGEGWIKSDSQSIETEADNYLAASILEWDKNPIVEDYSYGGVYSDVLLEILVLELENANDRRKCGFLESVFNSLGIQRSHPQYVERAFYLLSRLADTLEDTELQGRLRDFGLALSSQCT